MKTMGIIFAIIFAIAGILMLDVASTGITPSVKFYGVVVGVVFLLASAGALYAAFSKNHR